jgi:hypothetical protein
MIRYSAEKTSLRRVPKIRERLSCRFPGIKKSGQQYDSCGTYGSITLQNLPSVGPHGTQAAFWASEKHVRIAAITFGNEKS